MNPIWLLPLWLVLLPFCFTLDPDIRIEISQGTLEGRLLTNADNKLFRAFQGIPYAQPPIGLLRFQPPQVYQKWSGILNATKNSNVCYFIESDDSRESEDCLYLNVYTPVLNNDDNNTLPVLLWIHGGGYSHGNSLYSNFGPDFLINQNIVIVTINYRLGPFGFLSTGDTIISGNAGHKDQAAAIRWTFENIQAFGGNPKEITISGQSAGGSSVGYQLLYKKNEGLFRGAILESGSPLSPWSYQDSLVARSYAFDLAKQINETVDLSNSSSLLKDFLLSVDGKAIDTASTQTQITRPLPVIEPNSEDAFLTKSQYTSLENGDFIKVPLIIGTTSEEYISQGKGWYHMWKFENFI